MSSAGDSTEHIVHDAGDVGDADTSMGDNPCIELRAPDENLAADAVVRQWARRMVEIPPELPDAQPRVAGKRPERQERVERGADDNALGQDAADLGCGPTRS